MIALSGSGERQEVALSGKSSKRSQGRCFEGCILLGLFLYLLSLLSVAMIEQLYTTMPSPPW